ncbi:hypothetical protein F52700_12728 [Fusarium sp. NRRL 52700]|nr:hypothetical protein F52700_12728 [Fusarium sp. NRRL 52700]
MPIGKGHPVLSKEDTESLVSHAHERLTNPDQRSKGTSQDNYARDYARSGADKGAIVGGTIASGIIISFMVFFGVLVFKKYLTPRGKCNKRIIDGKPLCPGTETQGTKTSTHTSWRQTFNHQMSFPYADSVYSERSLRNTTAATQMSCPDVGSWRYEINNASSKDTSVFASLANYTSFRELYARDSYSSLLFVPDFSEAKSSAKEPSIAAPSEESPPSRSAAACSYPRATSYWGVQVIQKPPGSYIFRLDHEYPGYGTSPRRDATPGVNHIQPNP